LLNHLAQLIRRARPKRNSVVSSESVQFDPEEAEFATAVSGAGESIQSSKGNAMEQNEHLLENANV
jgi:hypothetical protein